MKYRIFYWGLLLMLFFNSCCKEENRPSIGKYLGYFEYEYPTGREPDTIQYEITESNEDYLGVVIKDDLGSVVKIEFVYMMEKNKVNGRLPGKNVFMPVYEIIG